MSTPVRLYIDTWKKVIVGGLKFTNSLGFPDIFYGDVITYHIYLLELNNQTGGKPPNPYSLVSVAGLSLRFAVGDRGTGTMLPVAEQNSWSKSDDNTHLIATVSFSTAEMLAAFNAGVVPYTKFLEIKWSDGGDPTTIYQQQVTIHPRAISPTTVVPSSPLTPISKEEVQGGYVPLEDPEGAGPRIRRSANKRWHDWVDDNGKAHLTEIV